MFRVVDKRGEFFGKEYYLVEYGFYVFLVFVFQDGINWQGVEVMGVFKVDV